ncbi:EI24 domain-containing protein [Microlunatus soli]|uniref:CysZ protein n=1 Tax=Microlunatus soli TaxID=630515 RepID=A0A1H1XBK4_9ACTN|nr:EI24 domain-containing protein [Microlunatus soli]SDT06647.1 CysZ protein [Microlunatus soli]
MITEALSGAALLGRGLGLVLGKRRIMLLGGLPPLITSIIFLALLITLIGNLGDLLPAIAAFAAGWPGWLHVTMEVAIGIALVGGSILIMVLVFSAVTLAVGSPAYDKIAELVDHELGDPPQAPPEERLPAAVGRAIRQTLALVVISLIGAIAFALLGLVPLLGQVLAPVLSALFGAWLLCIELLGPAFERRGLLRLSDRRVAMARRRWHTLGFAVPCFLLLAIPFVSVLVFPAATAGATLLARDLRAEEALPDNG